MTSIAQENAEETIRSASFMLKGEKQKKEARESGATDTDPRSIQFVEARQSHCNHLNEKRKLRKEERLSSSQLFFAASNALTSHGEENEEK